MKLLFQFVFICFVVFVDGFCWFTAPSRYQNHVWSSGSRRDNRILPYLGVCPEVNMLPHMGYSLTGKVILIYAHANIRGRPVWRLFLWRSTVAIYSIHILPLVWS